MTARTRERQYDKGWREGIEAAAAALEHAAVSPPEAKDHWSNAAHALRYMVKRGDLASTKGADHGR